MEEWAQRAERLPVLQGRNGICNVRWSERQPGLSPLPDEQDHQGPEKMWMNGQCRPQAWGLFVLQVSGLGRTGQAHSLGQVIKLNTRYRRKTKARETEGAPKWILGHGNEWNTKLLIGQQSQKSRGSNVKPSCQGLTYSMHPHGFGARCVRSCRWGLCGFGYEDAGFTGHGGPKTWW